MGQITLYMDDATLKKIHAAAKKSKESISKWAKKRLVNDLESKWPEGYFKLFGSAAGLGFEVPSDLDFSKDVRRARL